MSNLKKVRKQGLDKFYTKPKIAIKCINKVFELYDINIFDLIIEPSAGNGSFFNNINTNKIIGIDIEPEHKDIIKQDFLEYYPNKNYKNILTIGNPPFGRISSLAIKFFNHSAKFSNIIAFIIPKTFRKNSIQNKLDLNFHLIYDEDLTYNNQCCFSPKMNVKCCFQIWEKKTEKRTKIEQQLIHNDWDFLKLGEKDEKNQPTPPSNADFAIRAYGGKIGEIKTNNLQELRPKSWHWIKTNIDMDILIERFNKLDYSNSLNTARQNSMGKVELIELYNNFINSIIN